jgi:predicted ArsR family transcriptional regulator
MVQRTTSAARALASPSRVAILDALQRADRPLGVEELAAAADVHVNTAREHLERLRRAGFVDRSVEHRGTRGRPRVLWAAVDRPAAATLDERFRGHLLRTVLEGYGPDARRSAEAAERAGEAWAREHYGPSRAPGPGDGGATQAEAVDAWRQLAVLETHLEDLGLAPELDPDGRRVHLRDCPFLPLARARTEMVCSVHLGVARGVLACEDGPVRAERLEPFVGPGHCVLHLSR